MLWFRESFLPSADHPPVHRGRDPSRRLVVGFSWAEEVGREMCALDIAFSTRYHFGCSCLDVKTAPFRGILHTSLAEYLRERDTLSAPFAAAECSCFWFCERSVYCSIAPVIKRHMATEGRPSAAKGMRYFEGFRYFEGVIEQKIPQKSTELNVLFRQN